MKFMVFSVLALILVTPSVWAQQSAPSSGQNFGRASCYIPCPGNAENPLSSAALVGKANACITQFFGYTSPSGFFDSSSGMDGSGCLLPLSGVIPKGIGNQLAPSCCVVNTSADTCALRCELNTVP